MVACVDEVDCTIHCQVRIYILYIYEIIPWNVNFDVPSTWFNLTFSKSCHNQSLFNIITSDATVPEIGCTLCVSNCLAVFAVCQIAVNRKMEFNIRIIFVMGLLITGIAIAYWIKKWSNLNNICKSFIHNWYCNHILNCNPHSVSNYQFAVEGVVTSFCLFSSLPNCATALSLDIIFLHYSSPYFN